MFVPVSLTGVQLEMRIPGNSTTCRISGLEAGLEYNINVFAVINNSISVPNSITVLTCKCGPELVLAVGSHLVLKYNPLVPGLVQQNNNLRSNLNFSKYTLCNAFSHAQSFMQMHTHSVSHFFLLNPPKDVCQCQQSENTTCFSVLNGFNSYL